MAFKENRDKYFAFAINFKTEEERDRFKNYVFSRKESHNTPVYQTATEMMELHKEQNKRKR